MLHKAIYDVLSQDTTDDNPVTQLQFLQQWYDNLTSLDGIEYYYLSLKTLLSDPTTQWAVNKIFYEEYSKRDNNWLGRESETPFIVIHSPDTYDATGNNGRKEMTGLIKISVFVSSDENQSSNIVRNIAMRIKYILSGQHNDYTGGLDSFKICPENYGLSEYRLVFNKMSLLADSADIYYRGTFTHI